MFSYKAYIQLTRPVNLLIAFISIFIGGFVTGTVHPLNKLLLACLSGTFIMAGANAINDVFDLEIDRINKPRRPLPSGRIPISSARIFAFCLFIAGCTLGVPIHWLGFGIAITACIWLYLYSWRLKRTVLWGNFSVAFLSGLAFVYGGLAIGRWIQALIVGIFAFFFHFVREIIKDMEDIEGDQADGVVTLPIRYGIRPAQCWATGLAVILIGLTVIPFIAHIFNWIYLVTVIAGVDLVLIGIIYIMWKSPTRDNFGRISTIMKADMLIGLVAVFLGS